MPALLQLIMQDWARPENLGWCFFFHKGNDMFINYFRKLMFPTFQSIKQSSPSIRCFY